MFHPSSEEDHPFRSSLEPSFLSFICPFSPSFPPGLGLGLLRAPSPTIASLSWGAGDLGQGTRRARANRMPNALTWYLGPWNFLSI